MAFLKVAEVPVKMSVIGFESVLNRSYWPNNINAVEEVFLISLPAIRGLFSIIKDNQVYGFISLQDNIWLKGNPITNRTGPPEYLVLSV